MTRDFLSYLNEAIGSTPGKAPTSIEPDQIYHIQFSFNFFKNTTQKDTYIVKGKDIFNFLKEEGKDGCLDRFVTPSVKIGKVTFNEPLGARKTFFIVDELNNSVDSIDHLIAVLQGKTSKYDMTTRPKKYDQRIASVKEWANGEMWDMISFADEHPEQFEVLLKNFKKLPKGIQKTMRESKEVIHDPDAPAKISDQSLIDLFDKMVK